MKMNHPVESCPLLWFVCRFCRKPFPSVDTLKLHKQSKHSEHWTKVRCIVFEETLYDEPLVPSDISSKSNSNLKKADEIILNDSSGNCIGRYQSVSTSPRIEESSAYTIQHLPKQLKPNPFVLVRQLNSQEFDKALQRKLGALSSSSDLSNQPRKLQSAIDCLETNNSSVASPEKQTIDFKKENNEVLATSFSDDLLQPATPELDVVEIVVQCSPNSHDESEDCHHSSYVEHSSDSIQIASTYSFQNKSLDETETEKDPLMIDCDEDYKYNIEDDDIDSDASVNNSVPQHPRPPKKKLKRHVRQFLNKKKQKIVKNENEDVKPIINQKSKNPEDDLPFIDWLAFQREAQNQFPEECRNRILLDPDPTLIQDDSGSVGISVEHPITCKFCLAKLESESGLRNHAENCWLHNSGRHLLCVPCDKHFYSRSVLLFHNRTTHVMKDHASSDLPIFEWLTLEKENPKNVVLLEPDITLREYSDFVISDACPVQCVLCRQPLSSDTLLKNHVTTCWRLNKSKHVHCVTCNQSFLNHRCLQRHEYSSKQHSENILNSLKCLICDQHFQTRSDLQTHVDSLQYFFSQLDTGRNVKKNPKPHKEKTMHKEINTEGALYDWLSFRRQTKSVDGSQNVILFDPEPRPNQFNEITKENPIKCRLCSRKLVSAFAVKMHVNYCYQRNRKNHRYCIPCEKDFESPKDLQDHQECVHHLTKNKVAFKCTFCAKEFVDETTFENHQKSHKDPDLARFVCPHCPRKFKSSQPLSHHQLTHGEPTPFLCKFCGKSLRNETSLANHERTHTGDRAYACDVGDCEAAFFSKPSLRDHKCRKHFRELGLEEYLCPSCGVTVGGQKMLRRHMFLCGRKPFKCTHEGCPSAFTTTSRLRVHLRTHTGERPFRCEECGRAFSKNSTYLSHKRSSHEGALKKAQCPLCPKAFQGTWHLNRHLSRLHKANWSKVKKEKQVPTTETSLRKHVQMRVPKRIRRKVGQRSVVYSTTM